MEILILFLPLIASIISGFFGKYIGDRNSEIVTSALVSVAALLSVYVLYQVIVNQYEENIVIATSRNRIDKPIEDYCIKNNISYYRGSLENVSERFLKCAIHHRFDYAVRINGDNLFTDPSMIDDYCDLAISGAFDLISNVPNRTYPSGMSVEVIKVPFMRKIAPNFKTCFFIN